MTMAEGYGVETRMAMILGTMVAVLVGLVVVQDEKMSSMAYLL
jgi:hypothetical protein